jgi:eukaryotic-like serine/threonine-protein kinase
MRRFFRIVLLALVLMIVAMVSALTAMQLAIHGREVNIPKLVGMTPFEAERLATASGLQVVVERQFYSSEIPEGKIMTQVPAPGTKVRRGWSIRVAESLGPQRVAIPDVTGESERAAELNIKRRGLDVGFISQINLPELPEDQVAAQNPPASASGISAPKINLLVSTGAEPPSYVMPSLIGQPLGSATLTLQDAGMKVGKVSMVAPPSADQTQPSATGGTAPDASITPPAPSPPPMPNAASMIVSQTPAAGQKIVSGSTVNFEVR